MSLESGTYVADLNAANPAGTDPKAQGDDHIRLVKAVLRNSFAGFPGAVVVTGAETQGASVNDYGVSVSPGPAAYTASMVVVFKASHANTGAATLKVNALSAKALKDMDGAALAAGDIPSGGLVAAVFDGSDFLLLSGNDRAARAGDTYTGNHDFTAAALTAPTQGPGDGSSQVATTAYVDAADALKAPLASPALTGTPTAPTAAPGVNTTQIATTAFATQLAFQAALPLQAGAASPSFLYTDGTNAGWSYTLASQAEAEAGVSAVRLMTPQRTAQAVAALARVAPDIIVTGTGGGTLVYNTYTKLTLNALERNLGNIASLSSSVLTLPAGEYYAEWSAPGHPNAYDDTSASFGTRLRNATAGSNLLVGTTEYGFSYASGGFSLPSRSSGCGVFSLSASSSVELQGLMANDNNGLNGPSGALVNSVRLWRLQS